MRTSLNKLKELDDYVHQRQTPEEALLFEAKVIIDEELKYTVMWHKQTLTLINRYGRNNLRSVIADIHQQLFTQPGQQTFRQKILRLFNKH